MPATVIEEMEGYNGAVADLDVNRRGSLVPRTFIVEQLPVGDDPLSLPQIPGNGHAMVVGGVLFTLDRKGYSKFTDTSGRVTCWYSNDRRFRLPIPQRDREEPNFVDWSTTFRNVQIKAPRFVRRVHEIIANGGPASTRVWEPDHAVLDLDFEVLMVEVIIPVHDDDDVIQARRAAKAQTSCLHQFSGEPESFWVMRPATFHQISATQLSISYTWESDPGNFAEDTTKPTDPTDPNSPRTADPDLLGYPQRNRWFDYRVIPSQGQTPGGDQAPPTIYTYDLFPPTVNGRPNPFYNLTGWQSLPGRPVG